MDLDATVVDEQPVRRISCSRQRAEDAFRDTAPGPANKAIVERRFRPIDIGAVDPATAAAMGMDDPTQHTAISDVTQLSSTWD